MRLCFRIAFWVINHRHPGTGPPSNAWKLFYLLFDAILLLFKNCVKHKSLTFFFLFFSPLNCNVFISFLILSNATCLSQHTYLNYKAERGTVSSSYRFCSRSSALSYNYSFLYVLHRSTTTHFSRGNYNYKLLLPLF